MRAATAIRVAQLTTAVLMIICLAVPASAGTPRMPTLTDPVPAHALARTSVTSAASAASAGTVRRVALRTANRSAQQTVQRAVDTGAAAAARKGITTYATVIDRVTGRVVGRTGNDGTQVASESLGKMFLAAYYLVQHNGTLPADLDRRLRYMIAYSDDATASSLWTDNAVPLVHNRYGLNGLSSAIPRASYWGATRITAGSVARFLFSAGRDPVVGPWLFSAMAAAANVGSDGYDQNLGFNAVPGAGSKQGWGSDNWVNGANAVHSAGFGNRYVAAVLQSGGSGTYGLMPGTATYTATLINAASTSISWPTAVSIGASATIALAQRSLTLRAKVGTYLGRPVPGQKVRFYSKTQTGAWTYRAVFVTDSNGEVSYRVSAGDQGTAWKALVPGGAGFGGSESPPKIVYVRRAIDGGLQALPAQAPAYSVLIAVGHTGIGYAGQIVRVLHATNSGASSDGASIVGRDGEFKIYFRTPRTAGPVSYHVAIAVTPGSYQASTASGVRSILVR
jgi:hypothetical protein